MQIRTLCGDEHEALLDLLDGWELPDGWRGRDFFRRYLEDDPGFADENVWLAEDAGRLVSCVQIFPRRLRLGSAAVSTGGIGSVFTRPEARGSGIASELLERAALAMRERGMLLSLLFSSRFHFYERVGWISWPGSRTLLRPHQARVQRSPMPARRCGPSRPRATSRPCSEFTRPTLDRVRALRCGMRQPGKRPFATAAIRTRSSCWRSALARSWPTRVRPCCRAS